jgi:hypothetical protein
MRQIVLKGKTYETTRQMVDALAWATNRRGRVPWKDSVNVILSIVSYLEAHNVDIANADHKGHGRGGGVRYVINKLVNEGYAEVATAGDNKVLTMFKFKDDVDLNGHMPKFKRLEPPGEPLSSGFTNMRPAPVAYDNAGSEGRTEYVDSRIIEMPLPPAPKPERYLSSNVNAALDTWAERDADAYAKWAETLLERLAALYG